MIIRTPVIFGVNDDEENILAIGAFIKENLSHCLLQYQLLPYRPLGIEKYKSLGREYPMKDFDMPSKEDREARVLFLRDMLRKRFGIAVEAGAANSLKGEI